MALRPVLDFNCLSYLTGLLIAFSPNVWLEGKTISGHFQVC